MAENLLFAPARVGRLHLPNRIVMAPMTRNRTPGHVPNAINSKYYAQRASAGRRGRRPIIHFFEVRFRKSANFCGRIGAVAYPLFRPTMHGLGGRQPC